MTRAARIQATLDERFAPERLEIVDESHRHAGHLGSPKDVETHFTVTVVSPAFDGVRLVDRQRQIYAALANEFKNGLHALDLRALTPQEALSRLT